jgi:hypothetical protein
MGCDSPGSLEAELRKNQKQSCNRKSGRKGAKNWPGM